MHANRSAYVRAPSRFEIRDIPLEPPGPGQLLVGIAACGVCGTDLTIADRGATEWQAFGHEIAGTVRAVGPDIAAFQIGERVALDSSAPCGRCQTCAPPPKGRGRPDLCPNLVTYWGSSAMGFGELVLTPQECAIRMPEDLPFEVACLVEPVGVSRDLVLTAEVGPGDHVLVVGPGPLGLGAVFLARQAGAERVCLAGRSTSPARMRAGEALGADVLIETDRRPLDRFDFGKRPPDKILVTAPPSVLAGLLPIGAFGCVIAFIGIAAGPGSCIAFDADEFHFGKRQLRGSHAAPAVHTSASLQALTDHPELGRELVSHRFALVDIVSAMHQARTDRQTVKKMVMVAA